MNDTNGSYKISIKTDIETASLKSVLKEDQTGEETALVSGIGMEVKNHWIVWKPQEFFQSFNCCCLY